MEHVSIIILDKKTFLQQALFSLKLLVFYEVFFGVSSLCSFLDIKFFIDKEKTAPELY